MNKLLEVSSSPHIREPHTTHTIMRDVIIALMPALVAGTYFYGLRALWVTLVCVVSCVGFEWLWEKIFKRPNTVGDLSAVVTGLLLAFNVPSNVPIFVVVVGAFVAIILAKQVFGGIGQNFINPALAARAFLLSAYASHMRSFPIPTPGKLGIGIDAVTGATPLELIKNGATEGLPSFVDVFLGNIGGCIGEASALALIIGAICLLIKRVIGWHIPVCYIGTIFGLTFILNGFNQGFSLQLLYQTFYSLFLGGVILGAFFMATDYTTTPMTPKGQMIFAVGAGIITTVIRLYGGYPEGVSYSILFMNLTVPLIDMYVKRRRFGGGIKA